MSMHQSRRCPGTKIRRGCPGTSVSRACVQRLRDVRCTIARCGLQLVAAEMYVATASADSFCFHVVARVSFFVVGIMFASLPHLACICLLLLVFACVCLLLLVFRACPYRAGDSRIVKRAALQSRLELVTRRCDCTEHVAGKPLTGVEA